VAESLIAMIGKKINDESFANILYAQSTKSQNSMFDEARLDYLSLLKPNLVEISFHLKTFFADTFQRFDLAP
jgi:hypothetical protein